MEEEYITYQQAKLLHEIGFDLYQPTQYSEGVESGVFYQYSESQCLLFGDVYYRITLSLAQKFLRDKYELNVDINFKPNIKKWNYISYFMLGLNGMEYVKYASEYYKLNRTRCYDSYEDALSNGITEGLKMILNNKKL